MKSKISIYMDEVVKACDLRLLTFSFCLLIY